MRFVCAVLLCLFFGFNVFAQTDKFSETGVKEISLARDDGSGNPGETAEKFTTTDIPIHCLIELNEARATIIKVVFVAAKAAGLKPETKIVTVGYTTKANESGANFNASPNGVWAVGSYRVDIFLDGKLAKSQAFEIEKSAKEIKGKALPIKLFTKRKLIKKTKKN